MVFLWGLVVLLSLALSASPALSLQEKVRTQGHVLAKDNRGQSALEATQGQMDGFSSQLPYRCHLEEMASVGD